MCIYYTHRFCSWHHSAGYQEYICLCLCDLFFLQNESDYLGIISAAKGSSKSKQLAAQLIPRFFKHFPNLSSEAINAQLDLCEEEEFGVSCSFLNWDGFSLLLRRQQISWAVWTRYGQTLCNLQTADLKMIGKSKHNVFIWILKQIGVITCGPESFALNQEQWAFMGGEKPHKDKESLWFVKSKCRRKRLQDFWKHTQVCQSVNGGWPQAPLQLIWKHLMPFWTNQLLGVFKKLVCVWRNMFCFNKTVRRETSQQNGAGQYTVILLRGLKFRVFSLYTLECLKEVVYSLGSCNKFW